MEHAVYQMMAVDSVAAAIRYSLVRSLIMRSIFSQLQTAKHVQTMRIQPASTTSRLTFMAPNSQMNTHREIVQMMKLDSLIMDLRDLQREYVLIRAMENIL